MQAAAPAPTLADDRRGGLPPWTYFSEDLTALEKDVLFRRHWQIAGHVADIPNPGDFITFDCVGERALILRDTDGTVRAFHNLCRHRGARVVAGARGTCRTAIVCPFHGWSYALDGTLRGVAAPSSLPALDKSAHGLKPIELDIWMGFLFVRFLPGRQPPVPTLLARHDAEVAPYGIDRMQAAEGSWWDQEIAANWKAVRDVDNEGYHVPVAHPALQDLYGGQYRDEAMIDGSARAAGSFRAGAGRTWSVRHYTRMLPEPTHLPAPNRRAWIYITIFPNQVIGLYPDSVIFYQEFPISARRTLQRGAAYRHVGESRALRLSRYLASRIDRETTAEDTRLILWSCEAMESSGFDGILLSDLEIGVRSYHDALRAVLPVTTLETEPAQAAVANAALMAQHRPGTDDGRTDDGRTA